MSIRGIGVEGVASEIGALGRENFFVPRQKLIEGLCRRFSAEPWEAELAVSNAKAVNVVVEKDGFIYLVLEDGTINTRQKESYRKLGKRGSK